MIRFLMYKHITFLMLLFSYCFNLNANSISDILKTIPIEHQEDIKYLFHHVFLLQDGAYTIFGDKPVSSAGSFLISSWKATLTAKYIGKFGRSWETWQAYKQKFPMQKYVIIGEKYPSKKSELVALHVFVINKKKFLETIDTHLALFESVLGKKIDPKKCLDDIESGKCSFWTSINHNDMLMGILLGYGEHNATLFYKKSKRFRYARYLFPIEEKKLECSDTESYPMMIVNAVQFLADLQHPETKFLQKKYKDLRKKIADIYSQGDMLEITLSQLTSD